MLGIKIKGRRVLIKPDEIESTHKFKTETGQELAFEIAQDRKLERTAVTRGTVVDVGHLCWKDFSDETPWVQVGDWVTYASWAGQRIKDPLTNEWYLVMNDEDVIGTLERSPVDGQ